MIGHPDRPTEATTNFQSRSRRQAGRQAGTSERGRHGYGIRPLIIIMSGLKPTPLCLLPRVLGVVVIESRGLEEEEEEAEEEGCNGGNLLRRRRRERQRRHRIIRRIVNDQSGVAKHVTRGPMRTILLQTLN